MDNKKMGQFICELRKSKQMTQKDLATVLHITDKAVSKWERGLSSPDISLLSSISETLGVTTSELLNGEKSGSGSEEIEEMIGDALHYAEKTVKNRFKSLQEICAIAFSLLLLIGIVVCAICDIAISGTFTWSLFPISSIIFAWMVFFPVIKFGEKGLVGAMIALSVLIVPFLYVINSLIKVSSLILPIGIRMAVISVIFLWCIFALYKKLRTKELLATGIALLMLIPVHIIINFTLSRLIDEPFIDIWDVITISAILIASVTFFCWYNIRSRKKE